MADVESDVPEVRMDDDRHPTPAAESEARAPSPSASAPPPEPEPTRPKPAVRPKLDLSAKAAGKRGGGRSMFGVLLGTLNKAKIEDKERSASDAAKKRALIDQRLQHKLSKETSAVRKAEEARRGKYAASKKEDELALKDSMIRARMNRLPTLANFLLTSDVVPLSADNDENMDADDETTRKPSTAARAILDGPPRGHPPPLFFLPAVLLDNQKAFIEKRKVEVERHLRAEWKLWCADRSAAVEEITSLRAKAAEVEREKREAREAQEKEREEKEKKEKEKEKEKAGENEGEQAGDDVAMATDAQEEPKPAEEAKPASVVEEDVKMDDADPPGKDGDEKVEY
ncbi:hypothetical protein AURDEDRAFT_116359 [Auricularia subglabra TFB-10046 SS5]|nr:hypothetical protein AURDEDRAFT_116359 [Auricularia subglabra TFB-10046 SS5]